MGLYAEFFKCEDKYHEKLFYSMRDLFNSSYRPDRDTCEATLFKTTCKTEEGISKRLFSTSGGPFEAYEKSFFLPGNDAKYTFQVLTNFKDTNLIETHLNMYLKIFRDGNEIMACSYGCGNYNCNDYETISAANLSLASIPLSTDIIDNVAEEVHKQIYEISHDKVSLNIYTFGTQEDLPFSCTQAHVVE